MLLRCSGFSSNSVILPFPSVIMTPNGSLLRSVPAYMRWSHLRDLLVIVKHHLVIHFVNVVAGKNQNIFWIVCFHISHVLVNCICSSCIPFAVCTFSYGGRTVTPPSFYRDPTNTDSDMGIQPQRLILGQYAYRINS